MKHSFIDKYSNLDSIIHKLDSRVKIISSFITIIIITSEPLRGSTKNFIVYFSLILLLVILSKVPVKYILKRLLIVSPFILMAAIFYPVSLLLSTQSSTQNTLWFYIEPALSIFSKAGLALLILILLSSTTKFHNLLMALSKLRMPTIIITTSALLYRYIFILEDELLRTQRARASRTASKRKSRSLKLYGNQAALIFLRSWERSQTVYNSMISRGFDGGFFDMSEIKLKVSDIIFSFIFIVLFLLIKFNLIWLLV